MTEHSLGKTYRDGEAIVRQGEPGTDMFVVQAGEVEIIQEGEGPEVVLAALGPEEFFGEMALFTREVRSATVRAVGETTVLTVDRRTLLSRIQQDPSLAFRIIERMSDRIASLNRLYGRTQKEPEEED